MLKRKNNPERELAYDAYYTQLEIDTHLDSRLRLALDGKAALCFRVLPDDDGTILWDHHIETIGELMDRVSLFSVVGLVEALSECDERRARSLLSALRALAFENRICGLPKEARHLASNPTVVNQCVRRLAIETEYPSADDDEHGEGEGDEYDTVYDMDFITDGHVPGDAIPAWIRD